MHVVLLLEANALLRDGLALLIAQHAPGSTALHAGSLAQAMGWLTRRPDIGLVLVDPKLPDAAGASALQELRERTQAPLLVMSEDGSDASVRAAIEAGADGYVPKLHGASTLLAAVQRVLGGPGGVPRMPSPPETASRLTAREEQVLAHLADGASNRAIAQALGLAPSTVKTHVEAVLRKLGARTRAEAAARAARRAWNGPDAPSRG